MAIKLIELVPIKIYRKDMPQIKTEKLADAFRILKKEAGLKKGFIPAGRLKQTQIDIDYEKVDQIIQYWKSKNQRPKEIKPIVISKDNFIVDGHHRWATILKGWSKQEDVPYVRIDLPVREALTLYIDIANRVN